MGKREKRKREKEKKEGRKEGRKERKGTKYEGKVVCLVDRKGTIE